MPEMDKGKEQNPKEERAQIGTPAGESPAKGRERHGTECSAGVCPPEAGDTDLRRKHVDVDTDMDDLNVSGDEVGTTGGVTGTHVYGGIPAGGQTGGGTYTRAAKPGTDRGGEGRLRATPAEGTPAGDGVPGAFGMEESTEAPAEEEEAA